MLYFYKAMTKDGIIFTGTLNATGKIDAIIQLKSMGEAALVSSMRKVIDYPALNDIRTRVTQKTVQIENINRDKRIKKQLSAMTNKKKKTSQFSSPVMKKFINSVRDFDLKKTLNNLTPIIKPKKKKDTVTVDAEMYKSLENMFKAVSGDNETSTDNEYNLNITEYEENLKVEERTQNRLKEKSGEKAINWALIQDAEMSPAAKKNMKIRVKPTEILLFTRRLHIMISSGVSLIKALMTLSKGSTKSMKFIIENVIEDIQHGSTFSESIAKYPRQFNYTYIALISVGEATGSMEKCLVDILSIQEQQLSVKKKLKSATMYPLIVALVLVVLVIFGVVYFIPTFEAMFADQGMVLPMLTRVVFGAADVIPYLALGMAVIAIIFTILRKKIVSVDRTATAFTHKMLLVLPIVKGITNASYMYSFSSTVALMLSNGIRLKDTLGLAYRTIGNVLIRNSITGASAMMIRGMSFSEALSKQMYFDQILVDIVATGEESGKMSFALQQISVFYKDELDRQINMLMELVQPITMLLVGCLVGPVVIAVYMPILDMSGGALAG